MTNDETQQIEHSAHLAAMHMDPHAGSFLMYLTNLVVKQGKRIEALEERAEHGNLAGPLWKRIEAKP